MAFEFVARNGIITLNNSVITGSLNVSAGITGSLFGTASFATTATTSSYADNFTVAGTLTAQTIVAQTITSSTDFVTGSTRFGSLLANTHQFTGSVSMTGSLTTVGTASFNGNVGIGTTLPSKKLSISGSSNSGIFLKQGSQIQTAVGAGDFYSGLVFENTSTTNAWSLGYSQAAAFSINYFDASSTYSRYVTVTQAGNVGIGTTTPNTKLDISGSVNISGSGVQVPLQVSAGSTSLLFVSQSGNVGIGTTSPAYKLDVSGSARVQGGLVAPLLFNRITTTYTLVLADQGKMIEADFSTNLVITVPLAVNVAFPIGTEISVVMRNTGTVQIVGDSGFAGSVTVNSAGSLNTISTQYGAASLVKVDTNEWYLYGNLT